MTDFRLLKPGHWGPVIVSGFYGMRSVRLVPLGVLLVVLFVSVLLSVRVRRLG